VTETDDVAAALDEAARKWPGVPRSQLVRSILIDWAAGGCSPRSRVAARRALVGSLPASAGLYDRADDWPA
jgi:hypothetical protein